ncbi:HAD family hydrolase [Neobacillus vireti]|uniref:HAD family hydrolase n=1 Tax=Neobacillus vireti TaxID=220686 RepID=UPI002FFE485D
MIKGILFDKDGTLIEFNSFWVESAYSMIDSFVNEYSKDNRIEKNLEIAHLIGLDGNDVKEDALLAAYTSEDLANVISHSLQVEKHLIHKRINDFFYEEVVNRSDQMKAVGNLVLLFKKLKELHFRIGVVTADNLNVTQFTLKKLGINEYVDFIATADTYKKKPNVEAMQVFCDKYNLQRNEVIHIGDTMVDMEFAKHGLLGVGVLSGVSSEVTLRKFTPYVIETVEHLFDREGRFLFEGK